MAKRGAEAGKAELAAVEVERRILLVQGKRVMLDSDSPSSTADDEPPQ